MKLIVIFGSLFGFRGNKEYINLKRCNLVTGVYPDNHDCFGGMTWWGLDGLSDKTLKLSLKNPYVRDQSELLRYPVVPQYPEKDIGGSIGRFVAKLDKSNQDVKMGHFLQCRVFRRISKDGNGFTSAPKGKNAIRDLFKAAFEKLGISNAESLRPHALRGMLITNLANNPAVSLKEVMFAARHKTAAASATYQKNSSVSESNRVVALIQSVSGDKKRSASDFPGEVPNKRFARTNDGEEAEANPVESVPDNESFEEDTIVFPPVMEIFDESSNTSTSNDSLGEDADSTQPMYTQVQSDFLEDEMRAIQNGRMTGARSPPVVRRPRRSSVSDRLSCASRRSASRVSRAPNYSRGSYVNAARNPYRNPYTMHRSRGPSSRELEIVSMRQRLGEIRREARAQARYDHNYSPPYENDMEEDEALYHHFLGDY